MLKLKKLYYNYHYLIRNADPTFSHEYKVAYGWLMGGLWVAYGWLRGGCDAVHPSL